SITVFLLGIIIRITKLLLTQPHNTNLKIYPEKRPKWLLVLNDVFLLPNVRRNNKILWVFLLIFHISLLLLFIGHIELIKEFSLFQIIEHDVFLGKGFIGLILIISLLFFLFRRFISPYRELSVLEDYLLLILLFLTFIFGSQMDWARSWYDYSELTVEDYRIYLTSLLSFKPEIPDNIKISGHSFMLVLHVFFANLLLIFLPFSKLMHAFLTIPVNKLKRG
ncbi:MAG: respiratory nitrate reductase subunit gamma, partial [Spirochaetota bacterium]|nr:respiratory nitrate reductase subunit gamma [Spirochaetota bacterium]